MGTACSNWPRGGSGKKSTIHPRTIVGMAIATKPHRHAPPPPISVTIPPIAKGATNLYISAGQVAQGLVHQFCVSGDIDRSIAWYRDVLGFELVYKLDDWGWAELRSAMDDVNIGIGQNENIETGGGATLTFGVVDIDAARAWLEAHGVKFDGETTEVPGMVRLATFYDPDGNTFMLAQRLDGGRGRG
jgi:catechol 2,3-dioxygenase-like lactoylglutathione lyase family enzyme